jgi:hypothetical protein
MPGTVSLMQYDEDDLAESARSWEGRLAGDDAEAAARALAALRAEATAEEPADGAASQDSAYDVGRCLVIATPREIMALRAAAGAAGTIDEGEPLFGVCAIGLDPDGQAAVESAEITRATIATADLAELAAFIGSDPFVVFDAAALALIDDALRRLGRSPLPSAQARLLASRAASVGETATASLFALGRDGGAMLEPPWEPSAVTPAFACAWMAACLAAVLGIERQKRLVGGAPTIGAEPMLGSSALGCSVSAAARSQPRGHMAAARHVLRRLLPPAG